MDLISSIGITCLGAAIYVWRQLPSWLDELLTVYLRWRDRPPRRQRA